jgi:hypothetical protein
VVRGDGTIDHLEQRDDLGAHRDDHLCHTGRSQVSHVAPHRMPSERCKMPAGCHAGWRLRGRASGSGWAAWVVRRAALDRERDVVCRQTRRRPAKVVVQDRCKMVQDVWPVARVLEFEAASRTGSWTSWALRARVEAAQDSSARHAQLSGVALAWRSVTTSLATGGVNVPQASTCYCTSRYIGPASVSQYI